MKSATIQARKRFAAELAERDAQSRLARHTTGKGGGSHERECVPSGSPRMAPRKAARKIPASIEVAKEEVERYRMRRWWLDRYTLDEIRALAECLR